MTKAGLRRSGRRPGFANLPGPKARFDALGIDDGDLDVIPKANTSV